MISLDRLREVLTYDPNTGHFHWLDSTSTNGRRNHRAGKLAGCVSAATGYRVIFCDGKMYNAHRLAWFYVHGAWPAANIDHANMDRSDNRISNLRDATHAQNNANRKVRRTSASGVKGVYPHSPSGRWYAKLGVGGKSVHLGYFATKDEAASAYNAAATKVYGEFARAS